MTSDNFELVPTVRKFENDEPPSAPFVDTLATFLKASATERATLRAFARSGTCDHPQALLHQLLAHMYQPQSVTTRRQIACPRPTTRLIGRDDDLTNCPHPVLRFRHAYMLANVGSSRDVGRVEISGDGGTSWTVLAIYSGDSASGSSGHAATTNESEWDPVMWQRVELNLPDVTGTVQLRFSLDVDHTLSDTGWIIDDIQAQAGPPLYRHYLPLLQSGGNSRQ